MRSRWIQVDGELVPAAEYQPEPMHYVMPDIQPYQSMIDGSMIGSRSTHRAHIRQHGVIEIGNEKIATRKIAPAPGLKERLIHEVNQRWK